MAVLSYQEQNKLICIANADIRLPLLKQIKRCKIPELVELALKDRELAKLVLTAINSHELNLSEKIKCPGESVAILGYKTVYSLAHKAMQLNPHSEKKHSSRMLLISVFPFLERWLKLQNKV